MRTFVIIFLILCGIIYGDFAWAQLSHDQEERLKELEAKDDALKIWEEERPEQKKKLLELSEEEKNMTTGQALKRDMVKPDLQEGSGRFQAVRMNNSTVFILDTKEGHLWVWIAQGTKEGKSAEFLIYQGKVTPGSHMGEIINRTYKK